MALAEAPVAESAASEPSESPRAGGGESPPAEGVDAQAAKAKPAESEPKDIILRLARMKPGIAYDQALAAAKKEYGNDVRKATIEAEVQKAKARYAAQQEQREQEEQECRLAAAPKVDGDKLLQAIVALIDSFVWMSPERRVIVAVWILHTHTIEAADFTPYMHPRSPIKRCAKTLLERICKQLAHRPEFASTITTAALIDKVSKGCTLLVDEVDAVFNGPANEATEAKRAILNSGYQREGTASKMVKDKVGNWVSQDFSTFGPKMIAGIGHLPDTIEDRSLDILLLRKPKHVERDRFILGRNSKGKAIRARLSELRQRIEVWASQNLPALMEAEPKMPEQLDDRAIEISEPLCAIADACGGEWPDKVRTAIVAVRNGAVSEDDGAVVDLLSDIRRAFAEAPAVKDGKIFTRDLVLWLGLQERWEHFHGRGQPLRQSKLLSMLRDLEIYQTEFRIGDRKERGFRAEQFKDAFEACLPAATDKTDAGDDPDQAVQP